MGAIARDPSFTTKEPEASGQPHGAELMVDRAKDVHRDLEEVSFHIPNAGCPGSDSIPAAPWDILTQLFWGLPPGRECPNQANSSILSLESCSSL